MSQKQSQSQLKNSRFFLESSALTRNISTTPFTSFVNTNKETSFETKLANLILEETTNAKSDSNLKSIILSVPAKILKSNYNPFGDGQTNAKLSFANWNELSIPVIGIKKSYHDGHIEVTYRFHPKLSILHFSTLQLDNGFIKITPEGWNDSFYFNFDLAVLPINEFLKGIPENLRRFSNNRLAPNPAQINSNNALTSLRDSKNLGEGYNSTPWYSNSVHGRYPSENGAFTAIGGVITRGITDKNFGPFKQLYTCFESRNINEENSKGVPSGAGWHFIGDPAETILNTIDDTEIPVAIARSVTFNATAYSLNDIITAGWLKKDEAFVTKRNEFHWYVNPLQREVCTEIWVHPCEPNLNNNWGFSLNCGG